MSRIEASATREPNWSRRLFWLLVVLVALFLVVLVLVYLSSQTLMREP
jgi:uncharacterized protein involved in exopolysaccharide biosynthesis